MADLSSLRWPTAPQINFDSLGNLGKTFRENRVAGVRDRALANSEGMSLSDLGNVLMRGGDLEGGVALIKAGKTDTPTAIQEYNFAKQQGFGGSFLDYQLAKRRAGATNVTVNAGEKEYDKTLGKQYADSFIDIQKAGRSAVGQEATLDTLEKLTQDPNFYSGVGAERFALPMKQVISRLGGDPNSAASMETFRALSSKSVLDSMGGSLGTGFSNADREFVVNQVANLGNTPEGNRELIRLQKKVARRTQEIARLARDYAMRNGGRVDSGFDQALAQWAEQNPLFKGEKPATGNAPSNGNRTGTGVQWRIVP